MTEVALRGKALARLGMVSGTWATLELAGASDAEGQEGRRRRLCRLVALDHDPALAVLDDDNDSDGSDEEEEDGEEGEAELEQEELVVLVPPPLLFNLSGALEPCRCGFRPIHAHAYI
jgi:hypothetical protein